MIVDKQQANSIISAMRYLEKKKPYVYKYTFHSLIEAKECYFLTGVAFSSMLSFQTGKDLYKICERNGR